MSNSPPSPQQDEPLESDAVSRGSPSTNEETPIQPDPLPKSDPETVHPAPPISDPDEISHGEDEDDDEEGEEIDEETPTVSSTMDLRIQPPITDPHVSVPEATLASPTGRRGGGKRKKSKGKGRGKPSAKKQQEIESKLQTLRQNLNPIPFIPHKILDFAHHEQLLKKLGLWEFVHIDFDRTIRTDFIAQLVANYNPKMRASNVNGWRVLVNRADLARACRMPSKKLISNAAAEVDLDREVLSDESIGFLVGLLSDWVLLHEDTWLMPNEVADWMKLIKEGYPEKVDWPGLLWFMVEKEVKQGSQLTDCYYASHLQHLIKHQRKNLFLIEEPAMDEVELVAEANKEVDNGENVENVKDTDPVESTEEVREGDSVVQGPSTELTLGQDGEKEDEGEGVKDDEEGEGVKDDEEGEGVKDLEMMDAEKCKGSSDEEEGGEDQDHDHNHDHDREDHDQDQEPWLLNGKDNPGELYLQRCSAENADEFGNFEDRKEEEEEMDRDDDGEEDEDDFHGFPNDDSLEGDGFTGNFIQGLEANQMAFSSEEQLRNAASVDARVDLQHISSTPSFFNNSGKRVIEHDYHHPVNDNSSKRMRINETWDDKPLDFAMCMEQIQQMAQRARMMYEEKEHAAAQWGHTHQLLLHEVEKRDGVIQSLHKARMEETQRKDFAIGRLERELYLMGSVLDGYKKALKETRKAFAEYKERAQLPEEPTYKDAGPGGLMLTAAEIERLRVKREEEFRENCLYLEQRMREVEEAYVGQFDEHLDRVNLLDTRLIGLEADAKELIALHSKRKTPPAEQEEEVVTQVAKTEPVTEPMEEEAVPEEASQPESEPEPEPEPESEPEPEPEPELAELEPEPEPEPEPVPEPEEQVPEAAADNQPSPQPDEKVAEVAEVSIS